jgi:hypothetical protein
MKTIGKLYCTDLKKHLVFRRELQSDALPKIDHLG